MTYERTDEQLLREWMTETVWLPDSDLSGVQARIHRTPQHRGLLPPFDPRRFVRMLVGARVFAAVLALALVGGLFAFGLLPGSGELTSPGINAPTTAPEDEPLSIAVPSDEPEATELAIIAPTGPSAAPGEDAPARIHWEDGGITFDADSIRIEAFGRTFEPTTLKWLEHDYKGNRVEGLPPEAVIEAHWKDGGEAMRLRLDLRTDGEHWWVQRAHTFGDVKEPDNQLAYPSLKDETLTRVGERMRASIDVARPAKGIRLRIDGMRIDAFRADTIPAYSPRPKSPRLNVSVESKTMLPGQHQRLTAEWCLEGECWPADVRWSGDEPGIVDFSPSRGSWTEVTALRPGRGSITARQNGQRDRHTFWVYPRPNGGAIPDDMDAPSVAVATPAGGTLKLGQHVILTAWRCPTARADQLGRDGSPGTDDDGCKVEDTEGVRSIGGSSLALVELVGPSALLRVDGFGGLDGNIAPSPIQVGFLDGRSGGGEDPRLGSTMRLGTSSLYVRDSQWRGALLGDLDADGSVDASDAGVLSSVLDANGGSIDRRDTGWRDALDLNGDGRIDDVDRGLLEALVRSHAGEAPGAPVTARGSWLEASSTGRAAEAEDVEEPSGEAGTLTAFLSADLRTAAGPVRWSDGGVTFEAADFTIETAGRTFKPRRTVWTSGYHDAYRTVGDYPRDAELESHWRAQGTHMRLRFELRTDGTDWWIQRIRTYDGTGQPEYLSYGGLKERTRTPIGEAFQGSLTARATGGQRTRLVPDARVRIEDMRLEAFDLGTIPSPGPRARDPRLVVEMDQSALLRGQSLRASASWCLSEDECWPAEDVRWRSGSPDVVRVEPRSGSWTRVTARRPGNADLSYSGGNTQGSIGFEVRPRPGRVDDYEQTDGWMRWHLTTPREQVLKLGQYTVMTGWICPVREVGRLGKDGKPGTADDECTTDDVRGVWVRPGSGLAVVGTTGPSAVVVADSFEFGDDPLMSSWAGLSFDFRKGSDFGISNLYIRNGTWRGPLLGDLDEDGAVDSTDVAILTDAIEDHGSTIAKGADGWRKRLDLNADYVIDQVDADIVTMLAQAHAGELEPVLPTPYPRMPFGDERSTAQDADPSPTPEPSASPPATEEPAGQAVLTSFASGDVRTAARTVHWSDGGVTFEARDFTIRTNGLTFKPRKPLWTTGWHGPRTIRDVPRTATIQSEWRDKGRPMRLWLRLATNGRHWWVNEIQTYDGTRQPEYLSYGGLKQQTLTPVGEAFRGTLTAQATGGYRSGRVPGASIRIEGMRLEAFDVDAIPSPTPHQASPTLNVMMANTSPLPGQTTRVEAHWCISEDECWPAEDVRWRTGSPKVVKVEPTTGSWTLVTALRAGSGDVEAYAPRYGSAIGFEVRPRPGRIDDYERYDHRGFYLGTPREQVLKVGQYAVVTGWRCPTKGLDRLGDDREPGTDDDRCETDELTGVWLRDGSGLAHVGTIGPSAVILADAYELDQDDIMASWVGLRFQTDEGWRETAASYLYLRDAEWRGPLLGDLDEDGFVDEADVAVMGAALEDHGPAIRRRADGWRKPLDLNGDHVIDGVDVGVLELLVGAHSGQITPVAPTPRPPMVHRPFADPAGSPEPPPSSSSALD